jgi:hypothetical protein
MQRSARHFQKTGRLPAGHRALLSMQSPPPRLCRGRPAFGPPRASTVIRRKTPNAREAGRLPNLRLIPVDRTFRPVGLRRILAVSATVVVRSPRSASRSLSVCAVGRSVRWRPTRGRSRCAVRGRCLWGSTGAAARWCSRWWRAATVRAGHRNRCRYRWRRLPVTSRASRCPGPR